MTVGEDMFAWIENKIGILGKWFIVAVVSAVFGLPSGGCGGSLSHVVSEDLIKRLPKNSRKTVFQSETVVTIAMDRKSLEARKIKSLQRDIARTEQKIKLVEKERNTSSGTKADKLEREIDMLHEKVEYLEEVIDHQRERLELADKELTLAKAQFELSKVKLIKKHSIAFDGDESDFVDQVRSIQEDVEGKRKEVGQDEARLKRKESEWLAAKKRYYSSIGESSKGWWTE